MLEFAPSQSPGDFAARMLAMQGRVDAVAATAVTHHEVTDAVAQPARGAGLPCYALLNDFAQGVRQGYIGLNNLKVGRIAASMIATAVHRPGKLAVFVGGYRWHGHELRETGFRSYFREYAPQFQVLDTLVNLETRQLTYEATLDLLAPPSRPARHLCRGRRHGGRDRRTARGAPGPAKWRWWSTRSPPKAAPGCWTATSTWRSARRWPSCAASCVAQARGGGRARAGSDVLGQYFLRPELYLPESV